MSANDDSSQLYLVLINDEEQYSIWLKHKQVPAGWRSVGKEGTREECSRYVDEVWTDMRPKSLRVRMSSAASLE